MWKSTAAAVSVGGCITSSLMDFLNTMGLFHHKLIIDSKGILCCGYIHATKEDRMMFTVRTEALEWTGMFTVCDLQVMD